MKREYDFTGAKRGAAVKSDAGKKRITIRLDNDVLGWFRQQARGRWSELSEPHQRCAEAADGSFERAPRKDSETCVT